MPKNEHSAAANVSVTRRQLTFGTLAVLVARTSFAGSGAPSLIPQYTVTWEGEELKIELTVRNEGEATDVVVAGEGEPVFQVKEGEHLLVWIRPPAPVTRAPPRPQFAPVPAGAATSLGTWRFVAVKRPAKLTISLGLHTSAGVVQLPEQKVSVGG